MLTHVVTDPAAYQPGSLGRELTVTIGWGAVSRLDLVPASCGDPAARPTTATTGTVTADDIGLRISADADGEDALRPGHDVRPRAVGDDRALSTDVLDGDCLLPAYDAGGLAGVLPAVARSLGLPDAAGRGRRAARARALAQRGGGAGRRPGRRAAARAQRPRAVPAQPAARGPPPRRRVPVDHRHQHGHLRHRPAAGGARAGRLRGAGARGGPAAQRAVLGERSRPPAVAAAADRLRAGGRRRGWTSSGSVPASSTGRG